MGKCFFLFLFLILSIPWDIQLSKISKIHLFSCFLCCRGLKRVEKLTPSLLPPCLVALLTSPDVLLQGCCCSPFCSVYCGTVIYQKGPDFVPVLIPWEGSGTLISFWAFLVGWWWKERLLTLYSTLPLHLYPSCRDNYIQIVSWHTETIIKLYLFVIFPK